MKILITGGAGFIGSHIVERYQRDAEEIRILDNLRTGLYKNLIGLKCKFIEGSIESRDHITRAVAGVDCVIHLAAFSGVPESLSSPAECVGINVLGLLNTLESASAAGVKKFILASSAAVYGDGSEEIKTEALQPRPRSPYALTKLDGEYYLDLFQRERGLSTVSLRLFNVFGPRQNPHGAYAAAVPSFIKKALRGEDIEIHGDGGQTRDFIHVCDVADAFAFATECPNLSGVFNVGYGNKITIRELALKIIAATGCRSKIVHIARRPGDVRHSRASTDKLQAAGWKPESTIDEKLVATVEAFRLAYGFSRSY